MDCFVGLLSTNVAAHLVALDDMVWYQSSVEILDHILALVIDIRMVAIALRSEKWEVLE